MRSKPAVARKKRRTGKRVAALVLLLCVSAAIYLAVGAVSELLERREGERFYGALASAVNSGVERDTSGRPTDGEPTASSGGSPVQTRSEVDFEALRGISPDVVGWISLEGSDLDYPVVQGTDNAYYLRHLPDGTANEMGSIMMDAACDSAFQSDVTILHGHHMRSGAMFGNLDAYGDEAYFHSHPTMRLYTPRGDFDVAVIAAYTVDGGAYGYPTALALAVLIRVPRGFHWLDLLGYGAGSALVFVAERLLHDTRELDGRRRIGRILSGLFLLFTGIGQIAGALYVGVLLDDMLAAGATADFLARYWYVYGGNLLNALGIAVCGAICAMYHAREGGGAITFAGSVGMLAYALPAAGRFFFDGRWDVYGMYLPISLAVLLCGAYRRRSGRSEVSPQHQAGEAGEPCSP